ncbi:MAG: ATP-binding protein [Alphaproteobacteria bacterium]
MLDYERILQSSPDLYLILAPDLSILDASQAYLDATNTKIDDIKGRNIFDVFPDNPNDPAATGTRNLRASLERALESRKTDAMTLQKYDIPIPGGNGAFEERYWSPSNTPVLDAAGKVECIIHRAEDVTAFMPLMPRNFSGSFFLKDQIKSSLEALRDSEMHFAGIISSAMDGIITIDTDEKITVFNTTAEVMFGYKAADIMGKKLEILIPGRFRGGHAAHIKRFGETNVTHRMMGRLGEIVGLHASGQEFPIEASISQTGSGAHKLYTVIMRDITEKRRIEGQFLRAQRMESIGRLAGGIAHDLNNILAPIVLSIGLLKTMINDVKALEVLATIDVASKRGADVVQQVLSFARGIEGQFVEVHPRHLLADLDAMLKDTLPKDVSLRSSADTEVWTLSADPTQVHQILLNLCVNARDAMPNGGLLTITAHNVDIDEQYVAMNKQSKEGRYVLFSVTDTGSGIPLEIIDKIFEPFFTTKSFGHGTGLGLATVMAIAKSHGGFVNVYSETGKGTTFKVYLPAAGGKSGVSGAAVAEQEAPRGNGETILIVDDEASILAITSQTLQAFGYKVMTSTNGAEAVAVYAQHRNDIAVVLTDMMMPIMDGGATIQALKKINPSVKIIAASGLDANGSVAKATEAGVCHFLKKPYTAFAVLQMLKKALS